VAHVIPESLVPQLLDTVRPNASYNQLDVVRVMRIPHAYQMSLVLAVPPSLARTTARDAPAGAV
jgi:hypothetical protein